MQFSDRIHRLEATRGSHAYLVVGQEPILIDTGLPGTGAAILRELGTLGLQPKDLAHILLTHHDVDHIGNARMLQEATGAIVWASAEDLPFIRGEVLRPGLKRVADWILRVESPVVQRTYERGQCLAGIEVLATPGHTPGHVSLRFADVLFAGDLIGTAKGRLRMLSDWLIWDQAVLRRSLAEIGTLSFDWVLPGHGDPVCRGNLWEAIVDR